MSANASQSFLASSSDIGCFIRLINFVIRLSTTSRVAAQPVSFSVCSAWVTTASPVGIRLCTTTLCCSTVLSEHARRDSRS